MALQIGDTVGDYEIVGVLGKGGMGAVFRVRNILSDRYEAMKVVLPDLNADPGLADRFLREIRVQASLEHPHIAALRTALRIDNQVLMIMELVEGVSLDQLLLNGPLSVHESIRYVDQVLSALDLAHSRGIIHRDIKPPNIIVTPEGSVKLTDFGIARSATDRNLTQTGLALGSLYYMSPEQVQAQPADPRSDIYSVGVTFYEMVTGRRPIDGRSEFAILNAHLAETPVPPGTLNPAIPIMLGAAILKALAKQPGDRFQNAREFREALRFTSWSTATSPATEPADRVATTRFDAPTEPAIDASRAQIEAALTKSLGPIARVLMARISPHCSTAMELRDRLAEQISDPNDRTRFLRQLSGTHTTAAPSTPTPPAGRPAAEATQWDPAILAKAKQQLAVYAGPIASVLVERASKKVRTSQELYQLLAAEISSERDRAAFLKQTPWQK